MLEWYVLSIIGFSLAFAQHRTVLIANYPYPRFKLGPFIFDTSAWIGGFATLCMLIGGFFFSVWWWALLAMAIAPPEQITLEGRSCTWIRGGYLHYQVP